MTKKIKLLEIPDEVRDVDKNPVGTGFADVMLADKINEIIEVINKDLESGVMNPNSPSNFEYCYKCHGTGILIFYPTISQNLSGEDTCDICNGTGKVQSGSEKDILGSSQSKSNKRDMGSSQIEKTREEFYRIYVNKEGCMDIDADTPHEVFDWFKSKVKEIIMDCLFNVNSEDYWKGFNNFKSNLKKKYKIEI